MTHPLISCIMPTTPSRRRFVTQAIKYFNNQDYPNTELIIVDSGECEQLGDVVPAQSNIEYISLDTLGTDRSLTLGSKRNLAVSLARGEVICTWDDDDYFGPSRLSRQVAPLLTHDTDIIGLTLDAVVHLPTWKAYRCTPELHRVLFPSGVASGSIMFRKFLWGMYASYPNKSIGEDADFLQLLLGKGARLARIENAGNFVYIRHETLWPLLPKYAHGWQHTTVEEVLPADALAFYQGLRGEA